jgi:hypothetical protein
MSRRVPGEQDALANPNYSPAAVLSLIDSNRRARIHATGEDFITGEEADYLILRGYFPTREQIVADDIQSEDAPQL